MDIQMPEMDGLQATALIREKEKAGGGHIPIIAMTAHAMKGDRELALARGMDGYLSKPIDPVELFTTIESLNFAAPGMAEGKPAAPHAGQVIDEAELMNRVGGDAELLAELIDLFLQECPRLINLMQKALEEQNAKELEKTAHSLKGMVGNFSAKDCFEAALELERLGRSGELANAQVAFQDLEKKIKNLESLLAARRKQIMS
jgi:CheY-like chemotaxis protein